MLSEGNFNIKRKNTFKSEELTRRYEEALNDPELVALQRPLAVISARVMQLLQRVEDGITNELWNDATRTYERMKGAIDLDNKDEIEVCIIELDKIFKSVEDDYKSWSQVFDALELQRKLSESERKRLLEMKQFITAEEAMNMVRALTSAIYKNVQDPDSLRRIIYEFTRITGSPQSGTNTGLGEESG